MKVEIIEDANVLIPNKEHENFTEGKEVLKRGTIINGEAKLIKGKRRGENFTYRLFLTNNKQLIYLKKIKPMEVTEVTLGADSSQSPTVVKVPEEKKLFTKNVIIGTLIGAGAGFGISKYKKFDKKKMAIATVIGAVVGFGVAKYMEKRKLVTIKTSK